MSEPCQRDDRRCHCRHATLHGAGSDPPTRPGRRPNRPLRRGGRRLLSSDGTTGFSGQHHGRYPVSADECRPGAAVGPPRASGCARSGITALGCLAKDPKKRPESARALAEALEQVPASHWSRRTPRPGGKFTPRAVRLPFPPARSPRRRDERLRSALTGRFCCPRPNSEPISGRPGVRSLILQRCAGRGPCPRGRKK